MVSIFGVPLTLGFASPFAVSGFGYFSPGVEDSTVLWVGASGLLVFLASAIPFFLEGLAYETRRVEEVQALSKAAFGVKLSNSEARMFVSEMVNRKAELVTISNGAVPRLVSPKLPETATLALSSIRFEPAMNGLKEKLQLLTKFDMNATQEAAVERIKTEALEASATYRNLLDLPASQENKMRAKKALKSSSLMLEEELDGVLNSLSADMALKLEVQTAYLSSRQVTESKLSLTSPLVDVNVRS